MASARKNLDREAMVSLQKVLERPATRKSFGIDPLGTLERAGVTIEDLPPEYVNVLAELSPEELDILGRVSSRVPPEIAEADTNGYVVF